MTQLGTLWGVGVGPGDPDLLTLKAIQILKRSTVIAYVVDDKGQSYARNTALTHFPAVVKELPLHFSMSPQRTQRLAARAEAARQVSELLSAGQDVTFITEGDPLLYSTFQHLLACLTIAAPVEICPGVSALTTSAAEARLSLAVEQERMLVAAANSETCRQLPAWLAQFEVIILFKVHRHLAEVHALLAQSDLLLRAVLVQRASLAGQTLVTELADWNGSPPPYFSMLLLRSRRTP